MKNNGQITSDNLTEEFCKGNEAALEYLYDAYSGALYGVILKIIPDQELSRDLLQECLIKIWHKRAQYNGDRGTLYTWMLNLSRNHCIDYLRSKRNKNQNQNRGIDNFVYRLESGSSFQPEHIGVRKLLELLPNDQQQIIELSYFEGYTQKEISEEYNLPLGTVKSRAKAAMDKLKKLFKNEKSN